MLQIGLVSDSRQQKIQKQTKRKKHQRTKTSKITNEITHLSLFPTSAVLLLACCTMLAHAPVTHGTRQRHEVANAKCPLSPELRRWHSTCRNKILQDQMKAMKSLGSPTSQAQETNLINNHHRWQMVYELNSYKWIGQNYESSFRLTSSRSSVLPHLSKKPEQFPSNWSCWAIPNASQRFENKWTCKTPNLIRVSWKKIEAKQLEIECLDAVGPISSINSSSNLFG